MKVEANDEVCVEIACFTLLQSISVKSIPNLFNQRHPDAISDGPRQCASKTSKTAFKIPQNITTRKPIKTDTALTILDTLDLVAKRSFDLMQSLRLEWGCF